MTTMNEAEFGALVRRAKAGDDRAIQELLCQFEPDVRLAIRRRLPRLLRTQFDSMDFVQRVWASLFTGEGLDPTRFENREHLLGYLTGVAWNKVKEEYRRRTRIQKYDIRRQEPLYVRFRGGREDPVEVPSGEASPSEVFQAEDRRRQLLAELTPHQVAMVRLREQGLTFEEIAARLEINERTARRLIEALRRRLEDQL